MKKQNIAKAFRALAAPFFLHRQRLLIKPEFISLAVEGTCFFRCKQCDIWKFKPQRDRMQEKDLKLVIDKLFDWLGPYSVSFAGGETFLNKSLVKVIEHASKKGIATYVNTNGYLINEKLAEKIVESGIEGVHVSIDGLGEAHNESRGNPQAFERAEKAIKWLLKKRRNNKTKIATTTVLMKANIESLEEMLDWGKRLGLDAMNFQALWENFGVVKHKPGWFKKSQLWPDREKSIKGIKKLMELKRRGAIIGNTYGELQDYLEYFDKDPVKYGAVHPCFVGVKNFSIGLNGDVRLCYHLPPIGNILKSSPKEIWNNQKAQQQRQVISQCQRGCKILLCNRKWGFQDILERLGKKLRLN